MKFSHLYLKFKGKFPKRAFLLQVFPTNRVELSDAYVKYDTEYLEKGQRRFYPLPAGDLLVLLLIDDKQNLFTTIRSFDVEKARYYGSLVGKWITIERSYE